MPKVRQLSCKLLRSALLCSLLLSVLCLTSLSHVSGTVIITYFYYLDASASPTTVTVGETVVVSGTLKRSLSILITPTPVSGATVSVQSKLEGGSYQTVGADTTDSNGAFSVDWKPTAPGTYKVRAVYSSYNSDEITITVNPAPFPIEMVLAVAAVAAIGIAGLFFFMKRPKKLKPARLRITANPKAIFADKKATSTITIELLDQDGNPIAAEEDREVSLNASDGSISGKLTIPKGKSAVSTALTSSTKIGKAVLSASSKRLRPDSAEVAFTEKKRYCMHCGERMPLDAVSCSRCGNAPPSGADTKVCKNCKEVIPVVAKYCSECGAGQPT